MMPRIAIAGFQHETNSFSPVLTDFGAFEMADSWPELLTGSEVLNGTQGMNLPIAGFAQAARADGAELYPILWCAAEPAGHVTDHAFETIVGRILDGLKAAGHLDAVYLDLHGAMITNSEQDGEGALLQRIRALIGHDIPLAISLDLHANVSARMVDLTDCMTVFRTYPHLDMAETGARAWQRLNSILEMGKPAKSFRQSTFLVPLHAQHTGANPARTLYAQLPDKSNALVEMALGFTAGDTPDKVPAVVAYAATQNAADALAYEASQRLNAAREQFDTHLFSPQEAVAIANAMPVGRPVVLADVQDNPGAGASSDTTGLLRALVDAKAEGVLMALMHDPALAEAAHDAGAGAVFESTVGGRSGIPNDSPFHCRVRVETLSDGRCRYTGEMYGGGVATLGPSCVLSLLDTGADIRVIVTSIRNQCLDLAHFTSFGLDPHAARILCVKSTAHFRADFEPIAARVICVATPGQFPCDISPVEPIKSVMDTSV